MHRYLEIQHHLKNLLEKKNFNGDFRYILFQSEVLFLIFHKNLNYLPMNQTEYFTCIFVGFKGKKYSLLFVPLSHLCA